MIKKDKIKYLVNEILDIQYYDLELNEFTHNCGIFEIGCFESLVDDLEESFEEIEYKFNNSDKKAPFKITQTLIKETTQEVIIEKIHNVLNSGKMHIASIADYQTDILEKPLLKAGFKLRDYCKNSSGGNTIYMYSLCTNNVGKIIKD